MWFLFGIAVLTADKTCLSLLKHNKKEDEICFPYGDVSAAFGKDYTFLS